MYQIQSKLTNYFVKQKVFITKNFEFVTFLWPKNGDKSGFGEKSGCDKSEDALYLVH